MSEIFYNYLRLRAISAPEVSRQVVMSEDGTTYLYTRWSIVGRFMYNPSVNSYLPQGTAGNYQENQAAPTDVTLDLDPRNAGNIPTSPVLTDRAIRHHLSQPRRPLAFIYSNCLYGVGGGPQNENDQNFEILLRSPQLLNFNDPNGNVALTDATDGPHPKVLNVQRATGNLTWLIDFQIETDVNECPSAQSASDSSSAERNLFLRGLLANRWTMTHEVDGQGLTNVTVRGQATFRKDWLLNQSPRPGYSKNPDYFRRYLFLPILSGFQREGIQVTQSSDGMVLQYQYLDRQKEMNFPNRAGAMRIEAEHRQRVGVNQDPFVGASEAVSGFINDLANISFATQDGGGPGAIASGPAAAAGGIASMFGPIGMAIGLGINAAGQNAGKAINAASKLALNALAAYRTGQTFAFNCLPQYASEVTVSIWGHRGSFKQDLYWLALSIAFGRLYPSPSGVNAGANRRTQVTPAPFSLEVGYNLYKKSVDVTVRVEYAVTPAGYMNVALGMSQILTGPPEDVYGSRVKLPVISQVTAANVATILGAAGMAGIVPAASTIFGQQNQDKLKDWIKAQTPTNADINAGVDVHFGDILLGAHDNVCMGGGESLNPLPPGDGKSYGCHFRTTLSPPAPPPCWGAVSLELDNFQIDDQQFNDGSQRVRAPLQVSQQGFNWVYDGFYGNNSGSIDLSKPKSPTGDLPVVIGSGFNPADTRVQDDPTPILNPGWPIFGSG